MRKFVVLLALAVAAVFALQAAALEVSQIRSPKGIASGAADSMVARVHVDLGRQALPDGIMVFSGAGAEFFVQYWNDWDGNGVWSFDTSTPMAVPGSMFLPAPPVELRADTLYMKIMVNCATDSLTGIWVDE